MNPIKVFIAIATVVSIAPIRAAAAHHAPTQSPSIVVQNGAALLKNNTGCIALIDYTVTIRSSDGDRRESRHQLLDAGETYRDANPAGEIVAAEIEDSSFTG